MFRNYRYVGLSQHTKNKHEQIYGKSSKVIDLVANRKRIIMQLPISHTLYVYLLPFSTYGRTLLIAVQGHPGSSILVLIESSYATSC